MSDWSRQQRKPKPVGDLRGISAQIGALARAMAPGI
jgi:hypothetical protein